MKMYYYCLLKVQLGCLHPSFIFTRKFTAIWKTPLYSKQYTGRTENFLALFSFRLVDKKPPGQEGLVFKSRIRPTVKNLQRGICNLYNISIIHSQPVVVRYKSSHTEFLCIYRETILKERMKIYRTNLLFNTVSMFSNSTTGTKKKKRKKKSLDKV